MSADGPDDFDQSERAFRIEVPTQWDRRTDTAPFALSARPQTWSGRFVPNLTVLDTTSEAAALGFVPYAGAQLEGIADSLAEALVVAATRVAVAGADAALDLTVAHAIGGHDVTMVQRHLLVEGSRAVVASASVADADWPDLAALATAAVHSVSVAR